mmetsp:Transcript_76716/g.152084  ORF Transcript_76716/g.152084 Transcript_76716/m.152084 type:complete len:275 (-) Transcript_76716:209-1033(-)
MPISADAARVAETDLNEPNGAERAAALASFQVNVKEAVGEEAASSFQWALLAALRQSKWDSDQALKRIKKLTEFASKNEQYFKDLAPEEFLGQAKIGMTSHLPTRNANGELVMLINGKKIADYAKSYTMRDMLRYSVFYMTLLLQDEETQVNGAIILEDLHDYPIFALNSMKGMGPSGMKASFDWLGAAPLRLRGLYVCRQPWYVGMMLTLVKPFMSKKLRERTHLYGQDTAAMLAAAGLQPEQVPLEYGGTLADFDPAWYLRGKIQSGNGLST